MTISRDHVTLLENRFLQTILACMKYISVQVRFRFPCSFSSVASHKSHSIQPLAFTFSLARTFEGALVDHHVHNK